MLLCLQLLLGWVRCGGSHWNYQVDTVGPAHWQGLCQTGQSQSPVNIQPQEAEDASFPKWKLKHYEAVLKTAEVTNNGHTLQLSPSRKEKHIPSLSGGGLEGKYILAQFHLHWGNRSQVGSEHMVGGSAFPMELHLVHYNSKYSDLGEAVKHEDGLAVVGILHHLSAEDSPGLQPLIEAAVSVSGAGQRTEVGRGLSVKSLLPPGPSVFYRYSGSLTTPTCNEVVTWTILHHSAPISEYQLNLLRGLKTGEGFTMGDNYRPVMPLNGRKIQFSGREEEKEVVLGSRMVGGRQGQVRPGGGEVVEAGLVPGWAVVLISLAVALNVGLAVWLVSRRRPGKYQDHSELPTRDH